MDKQEIQYILSQYHWMINSIQIMRESLMDAGDGLTAQYGIEAIMPKGKGTTGDPIYQEVVRRSNRLGKVERYEKYVRIIQDRIAAVDDERESEVLHWLLEGKSYRWIADHMGLSHSHIKRLREDIVEKMVTYVPNVPDVPNDTKLKSEKQCG